MLRCTLGTGLVKFHLWILRRALDAEPSFSVKRQQSPWGVPSAVPASLAPPPTQRGGLRCWAQFPAQLDFLITLTL